MANNKSLLKNFDASFMKNVNKSQAKIVIGIVLIIIGIFWYFSKNIPIVTNYMANVSFVPSYNVLIFLFIGLFGLCLLFIGVLLAWMGWEDYKVEKEMAEIKTPEKEVAVEEPKVEEPAKEEPKEEPPEPEEEPEKEEETSVTAQADEFKCDECGKVLKSKAGLAAHKRSHN